MDHGPLPVQDAPFLVAYATDTARGRQLRRSLPSRAWSMWRYRELLPVNDYESRIDLGAGGTPLVRLQRLMGSGSNVWIKDESGNPTGSFKARGLSLAVNRARELGAPGVSLPSAGNAAVAAAAYCAAANLRCRVAMPMTTPEKVTRRCRALGAEVLIIGQDLTESAAQLREYNDGFWDLSTFKEPYRVEGKKTIGFELVEQLDWTSPDWIVCPTGGGTGIVALQKAFKELAELGIVTEYSPRLVAVQMEGCAPIVAAFEAGADHAVAWSRPTTKAWGLRVPISVADFLILNALRESGGTAVAVPEDSIASIQQRAASQEGLLVGPEGAAALAGLETLLRLGTVKRSETVVVLQTGSPDNYA